MPSELHVFLLSSTVYLDVIAFVLLSLPAIAIARMASRTSDFVSIKLHKERVHEVFIKVKEEYDETAWEKVGQWKPWHNILFYSGLFFAAISHLIKLTT